MLIEDLRLGSQIPSLHAQIIRLWSEFDEKIDGPILRLVLRDLQGDTIDAKAFGVIAYLFVNEIKESHFYYLSNFLVVPVLDHSLRSSSTITDNTLVMFFTNATIIEEDNIQPFQQIEPVHTPISEIINTKFVIGKGYVHVLGKIEGFESVQSGQLKFKITEESGLSLICWARGTCVDKINEIREKHRLSIYVCSLKYWKHKIQNGSVMLISEDVSDIIDNPNTEEATDLLEWFQDEDINAHIEEYQKSWEF